MTTERRLESKVRRTGAVVRHRFDAIMPIWVSSSPAGGEAREERPRDGWGEQTRGLPRWSKLRILASKLRFQLGDLRC